MQLLCYYRRIGSGFPRLGRGGGGGDGFGVGVAHGSLKNPELGREICVVAAPQHRKRPDPPNSTFLEIDEVAPILGCRPEEPALRSSPMTQFLNPEAPLDEPNPFIETVIVEDKATLARLAGCASGTGVCSFAGALAVPLVSTNSYGWQVAVQNAAGQGPWSNALNFTVL